MKLLQIEREQWEAMTATVQGLLHKIKTLQNALLRNDVLTERELGDEHIRTLAEHDQHLAKVKDRRTDDAS